MDAPEIITVATATPACDGGGALGHPRVFLKLGAENATDCPYCGRRYVLAGTAKAEATDES